MDKAEFVSRCGELLAVAKPNLVSCELRLGKDIAENTFEKYIPDEEYVEITCKNGYTYVRPIEGNTLCDIACEIFGSMRFK